MIYLITGAIGTGKTTWVVDQLIQQDEKNKDFEKKGELDKIRKIYSNIEGLKIDHEQIPDDWRTTPNNSVIAYDECHKLPIFQPNRKQLHDDKRIIALNESRHTGHDIYFITQAPKFLHQHVRSLCNQHFHFHRPMGLKIATVFMWRHGNTTTPDSQQAKNLAESSFAYSYKKDVQKNFESIEEDAQHTSKVNIPKKIIFILTALVCMISFIVYALFFREGTTDVLTGANIKNAATSDLDKGSQAINDLNNLGKTNNNASDLSVECRKAVNVEKAECVKWFDDLSKNNGSVTGDNSQNTVVSYNPNQPFQQQEIQKNVRYEVTAKPIFSGCMMKNGRYVAYTQQGTILNEVSQDDCKRLIQDADRPFNYFANSPVNNQNQQEQAFSNQQQQQTYKHEVYANNQVEPHLQQKITGANAL